jgi:hypothetical protein
MSVTYSIKASSAGRRSIANEIRQNRVSKARVENAVGSEASRFAVAWKKGR